MFGIPITTIKAIVFFALGFALGNVLVPHNAFAAVTFTSVPSGNIENPVSVQVTIDDPSDLDFDTLSAPKWFIEIWGDTTSGILNTGCVDTTDASGTYTFSGSVGLGDYNTVAIVGGGETCEAASAGETITQAASFSVIENTGTGGGGSLITDFDIWGDNSGTDMAATVVTGVQETTQTTLPFIGFVGISLAFIILLQFVVFTKRTIEPVKTGKKTTTPDEYTKDHPDYKAYKRGREIIEKEHPGMFDD